MSKKQKQVVFAHLPTDIVTKIKPYVKQTYDDLPHGALSYIIAIAYTVFTMPHETSNPYLRFQFETDNQEIQIIFHIFRHYLVCKVLYQDQQLEHTLPTTHFGPLLKVLLQYKLKHSMDDIIHHPYNYFIFGEELNGWTSDQQEQNERIDSYFTKTVKQCIKKDGNKQIPIEKIIQEVIRQPMTYIEKLFNYSLDGLPFLRLHDYGLYRRRY